MKIIFSKNNYYFERNVGIEPTTSNWNVRILPSELIPHLVAQVGLEPTRPFRSKGFSYHYNFRYHLINSVSAPTIIGYQMFVVWTLS